MSKHALGYHSIWEVSLNQNKKVWTIDNNSFEDLSKQKILEDLVTVLNIWANPLKFNICRDGGVKFLVKGAKRTVFCSVKGCTFQMNFLAPNKKSWCGIDCWFRIWAWII